ncbi:MAG: baseplate J/gp47 family protein [Eubacterium sp.]|jgi:uncharacterized phage protein gp47/JayE|nr:baseplate J/gp47 family protein [Eubacterium sp.]
MENYQSVLERMLGKVPGDVDKREGSIIYDALAPAAMELARAYTEFHKLLDEAFADTASREFLIRHAAERGLEPYPATQAVLRGEFSPSGIDVLNCRFSLGNMYYTAFEKIVDGVYKMRAETSGTEGNLHFGSMVPVDYIEGLESSLINEVLILGMEEEETEKFRQRYFESFSAKTFGGNKKDYIDKVEAITGGTVKVESCWNGGGTVKLIILDNQFNKASKALIEEVQELIDPTQDGAGLGLAPIGHTVTVDTVSYVPINIKTKLIFKNGFSWEEKEEQIKEVIYKYFLDLKNLWANQDNLVIRTSQIEARLLSLPDIEDVSETIINDKKGTLTLAPYEIPVLGGISYVS